MGQPLGAGGVTHLQVNPGRTCRSRRAGHILPSLSTEILRPLHSLLTPGCLLRSFFARGPAHTIAFLFFVMVTLTLLLECCPPLHVARARASSPFPPHVDGDLRTLFPRCALKACGNLGDYSQANDLLARMAAESLTPDIVHWNHALRASATCARWQEARLRLQEMEVFEHAVE